MTNEDDIYERYRRQMILPGFGAETQRQLKDARVLVVGAGGLGCPALMVLAGAGIGKIGLVDDGLVELNNLHRQFLYRTEDIGRLKTDCAQLALRGLNPDITVNTYPVKLKTENAWDMAAGYDILLDCTDNFATRYLLNDLCFLLEKPLVYGAVARYEGQVAVFYGPVTYRDLFPDPPRDGEIAGCNEAGVLGVLPGIIGHFMANECIKLIRGTHGSLRGKLMTYSSVTNQTMILEVLPTQRGYSLLPKSREEFEAMDYPALCAADAGVVQEIGYAELNALLDDSGTVLVDVRELHEMPALKEMAALRIPLQDLPARLSDIRGNAVVFICQSGIRSRQAVKLYKEMMKEPAIKTYSLRGGVNAIYSNGILS